MASVGENQVLSVKTTGVQDDGKLQVFLDTQPIDTLTLRKGVVALDVSRLDVEALNQIARRVCQLFQRELSSYARHGGLYGFNGSLQDVQGHLARVTHTQYLGSFRGVDPLTSCGRDRQSIADEAMTEIYRLVMITSPAAVPSSQQGSYTFGEEEAFDEASQTFAAARRPRSVHRSGGSEGSGSIGDGDSSTNDGSGRGGYYEHGRSALRGRRIRPFSSGMSPHRFSGRGNRGGSSHRRSASGARAHRGEGPHTAPPSFDVAGSGERTPAGAAAAAGVAAGRGRGTHSGGYGASGGLNGDGGLSVPPHAAGAHDPSAARPHVADAGTQASFDTLGSAAAAASGSDVVPGGLLPAAPSTGVDRGAQASGTPTAARGLNFGDGFTGSPSDAPAAAAAAAVSENEDQGDEITDFRHEQSPRGDRSPTAGATAAAAGQHGSASGGLRVPLTDRLTGQTGRRPQLVTRGTSHSADAGSEVAGGDGVFPRNRDSATSPLSTDLETGHAGAAAAAVADVGEQGGSEGASTLGEPASAGSGESEILDHSVRSRIASRLQERLGLGEATYASDGPFRLEEIPEAIREGSVKVFCLDRASGIEEYIDKVARQHILLRALDAAEGRLGTDVEPDDLKVAILRLMAFMANYDQGSIGTAIDWFMSTSIACDMHHTPEGKLVLAAVSQATGEPNKEWLYEIEVKKVLSRLKEKGERDLFSIGKLIAAREGTPFQRAVTLRSIEPGQSPRKSPTRAAERALVLSTQEALSRSQTSTMSYQVAQGELDPDVVSLVRRKIVEARQEAVQSRSGLRLMLNASTQEAPEANLDEVAVRYEAPGTLGLAEGSGPRRDVFNRAIANFIEIHRQKLRVGGLVEELAHQPTSFDRFHQSEVRMRASPRRALADINQVIAASESPSADRPRVYENVIRLLNDKLAAAGFARGDCQDLVGYVLRHGCLPQTLEHRLSVKGESLQWQVARLIYLAFALEPKSTSPFSTAMLKDLRWMFQGEAKEDSCTLLQFIKRMQDEIHSCLSVQQARWGAGFQALFEGVGHEPQEIYAEAGSGKTTAVNFFLDYFHKRYPGKKVLYVSPIAKTEDLQRSQWLQFAQMPLDGDRNRFVLPEGWDAKEVVLIVDESHCLAPGVPVELTSTGGTFPIAQLLKITATPITSPLNLRAAYQQITERLRAQIGDCERLQQDLAHRLQNWEEDAAKCRRVALLKELEKVLKKHASHCSWDSWLPEAVGTLGRKYEAWLKKVREAQTWEERANNLFEHSGMAQAVASNAAFEEAVREKLRGILGAKSGGDSTWTWVLNLVFGNPKKDAAAAYKQWFSHKPGDLDDYKRIFGEWDEVAVAPGQLTRSQKRKQEMQEASEVLQETMAKLRDRLRQVECKAAARQAVEEESQHDIDQVKRARLLGRRLDEVEVPRQLGHAHHQLVQVTRQSMEVIPAQPRLVGSEDALGFIANQVQRSAHPRIQVITPGFQWTKQRVAALAPILPGKKWLFHCSDRDGDFGKNLVYDGQGRFVELTEDSLSPADELVMLYDNSNKQGGDFGSYSRSAQALVIDQHIFLNISEEGALPSEAMTEVDLCQAMYRLRGGSNAARVYCTERSQEALLEKLRARQQAHERILKCNDVLQAMAHRQLAAQAKLRQAFSQARARGDLAGRCESLVEAARSDQFLAQAPARVQQVADLCFEQTRQVFESLAQERQAHQESTRELADIYRFLLQAGCDLEEISKIAEANYSAFEAGAPVDMAAAS